MSRKPNFEGRFRNRVEHHEADDLRVGISHGAIYRQRGNIKEDRILHTAEYEDVQVRTLVERHIRHEGPRYMERFLRRLYRLRN